MSVCVHLSPYVNIVMDWLLVQGRPPLAQRLAAVIDSTPQNITQYNSPTRLELTAPPSSLSGPHMVAVETFVKINRP